MLNFPLPGQPVKMQADMGSDNAKKIHQYGGSLSGNQYKVLTHIAWTAYDPKSIPKGAKGRDGSPAQPLRFFGSAQASAMEALGNDKTPAVALRLWNRAVKELIDLGILKLIDRAIPSKRNAQHEIDVERLVMVAKAVDKSKAASEVLEQKVPEVLEQKVLETPVNQEQKVPETPGVLEQEVPTYLQGSTTQVEFSNQKSRRTTPARRAVSSPRAREPKLLASSNDDSSAYDKASRYLLALSPERHERAMQQTRQALGADAPVQARAIHAAQLAGHVSEQESEAQ